MLLLLVLLNITVLELRHFILPKYLQIIHFGTITLQPIFQSSLYLVHLEDEVSIKVTVIEEHGCSFDGWHEVAIDCLILYRSSNCWIDQCPGSVKKN